MTGCIGAVDFELLNGAGLEGIKTKKNISGYDASFVDWVMVRRGMNRRDGVNKGNCIAKIQREFGSIHSEKDAQRVAAQVLSSDYQASTKRHKLFAIEDWCNYLGFEVKFRKPIADRRCPHYLTQEQLSQLVHAVKDYQEYALVAMFIFTGARLGEVVNLNLGDVSFEENTILIRNTKNSRDRIIPLSPGLSAILREYLYRRGTQTLKGDSPLFVSIRGHRLSSRCIQRRIEEVAKRARLPHIHVHMLRHSFASAWVENQGDIFHLQMVMGHRNVSTTMIYLHTNRQVMKRVYESSMPRL